MEVLIEPEAEVASVRAARRIARMVRAKPGAVLGLAAGSTPVRLYAELIRLHREEGLDFSGVRTFNLDEYLGLGSEHGASFHRFMAGNFFDHVNIGIARVRIPNGMVDGEEVLVECAAYEEEIRRAGGIDLQVLGIGSDGHIGFNEPGSSLASRTRIKSLTKRTREDNARFFGPGEEVPRHAITMGIGTILEAREVMLLAFGERKAAAVAGAVEGPVTASHPASALQLHPTVRVYLDEAAAAKLERAEYYRWEQENQPSWQRDG